MSNAYVSPTPMSVYFNSAETYQESVRMPDPSIVKYNEDAVPQEMITALLFEDVGGIELATISRHDIIDGIDVSYSIVGNITDILDMFNSNNIISGFEDRDTYFNQYPIDIGILIQDVSINDDGDLVIEFSDLSQEDNVEVSFLADGTMYSA